MAAAEFSGGGGDRRRSIALLWGLPGPVRRGPKPSRSVDEVVLAAIALADAEGLGALSIRRVAEALGLSAMSLYTYVPSKEELVDLMIDRVAAESLEPPPAAADWRTKLEQVARQAWVRAQRHPWIMQAATHRPTLGPNVLSRVETTLQAVDGLGLDEFEMDLVTTLVENYVRGSVRAALEAREVEQRSGITDEQWWALNEDLLKALIDPSRYPVTVRLGQVFMAARGGPDRVRAFEFGLQRVLDGIGVFIDGRRSGAA